MEVDDLIIKLCDQKKSGHDSRLPDSADTTFAALADLYLASSSSEMELIRSLIPDSLSPFLLGIGDRFSILAARTGSKQDLIHSLVAHALEDFRIDPRENLVRLAVVAYVAERLPWALSAILELLRDISSMQAMRYFTEFFSRTPRMQSLESMNIEVVHDPDGISFRQKQML